PRTWSMSPRHSSDEYDDGPGFPAGSSPDRLLAPARQETVDRVRRPGGRPDRGRRQDVPRDTALPGHRDDPDRALRPEHHEVPGSDGVRSLVPLVSGLLPDAVQAPRERGRRPQGRAPARPGQGPGLPPRRAPGAPLPRLDLA